MAIAVTDRAGRLVCASDLFGEWFPGFPTPPHVTGDPPLSDSLGHAARAAWRDGEARAEGIVQEIGRAHVGTPVTHAHTVGRLLLEKTKTDLHSVFIFLDIDMQEGRTRHKHKL